MRALLGVVVIGCGGSIGVAPPPVMPPIFDHVIVLGQRVGPVSLGMSEAQLLDAIGPIPAQSYGGNRRGYVSPKLELHAVVDLGHVVQVAPDQPSYATESGLRVGAAAALLEGSPAARAWKHEQHGSISYCFADKTLITVAGAGAAMPASVCPVGTICDIVVGGCAP